MWDVEQDFYDSPGKGWPSGDRYRSDTGYDQDAKQLAEEEQAECEFAVMDAENPESRKVRLM